MMVEFLSTPSARRATLRTLSCLWQDGYFYPRPPRGGRLFRRSTRKRRELISIHALREEGDLVQQALHLFEVQFLSTPSARRATLLFYFEQGGCPISIHALREEGDVLRGIGDNPCREISIHALREEGDPTRPRTAKAAYDFYPRPPRGGRLLLFQRRLHAVKISIHALREEGDEVCFRRFVRRVLFLSTPSARRATWQAHSQATRQKNFYPRPPRGGRLYHMLENKE